MKQKLPALAIFLMLAAAFWGGCNEPTPFGADQLEDERENYTFTDTLTVICTIEPEDSLLTSDPNSTAGSFLCGELNDPIFGKSSSEVFSLLSYDFNPLYDTTKHAFDSIVLYMRYAPSAVYGDTTQRQTLSVFRLDKHLDNNGDYYAESSIPASELIGSLNDFFPRPYTNDSLFDPASRAPYVSVRLSDNFGRELFHLDSATYASDSAFFQTLRGIKISTSSGGASPGAMLAFNLNNSTYSRLRLYYHEKDDSTARFFDYFFAGANKFTHFTHDYSGSQAGQKIGMVADDLLYVQAMQGLKVKVEIPYVNQLENIAINKAQLVLTTAPQSNDSPWLTHAEQLVLTEKQGDSTFVFTSDVLWSLGPAFTAGFSRFGGNPELENINGTLVERYRLTMSDQMQSLVDDISGDIRNRTVYINLNPQGRVAQRSIFYGPKSATFPAKLELKYTQIE
jgi:hypothetical protein